MTTLFWDENNPPDLLIVCGVNFVEPVLLCAHTWGWDGSPALAGLIWDLRVASGPLGRLSQRKRGVLHWHPLVTDAAHVAAAAQTQRERQISDFSRSGKERRGRPRGRGCESALGVSGPGRSTHTDPGSRNQLVGVDLCGWSPFLGLLPLFGEEAGC